VPPDSTLDKNRMEWVLTDDPGMDTSKYDRITELKRVKFTYLVCHVDGTVHSQPLRIMHSIIDAMLFVPSAAPSGTNRVVYTMWEEPKGSKATPSDNELNDFFDSSVVYDNISWGNVPLYRRSMLDDVNDLYIPLSGTTRLTGTPRCIVGRDGCIFQDRTNLGIVEFHAINDRTLPLVCGMPLTSPGRCLPHTFGGCYCIFDETPGIPILTMRVKSSEHEDELKYEIDIKSAVIRGDTRFLEYHLWRRT
jgi:hypothetical protein